MSSKQFTKRGGIFWSRDMVEKFIELLKNHECLYNNKNKLYYNRHAKDEICKYILLELRKKKPNIQISDIRRKLKVLRTQFARENRLLSLSRIHGRLYEPKLWCYHKLLFLEKHTTCVTTIHSKPNAQDDADTNTFSDEENFNYDDIEDSSLHTSTEVNMKEEILSDNTSDRQYEQLKTNESNFEAFKDTIKIEDVEINDKNSCEKYEYLGELVVSQIEDIDVAYRADFAWDLQCLVRKYILKSKVESKNDQNADETEPKTTKELTFHKGSHISLNVNFL